jgi:hypothetical protein
MKPHTKSVPVTTPLRDRERSRWKKTLPQSGIPYLLYHKFERDKAAEAASESSPASAGLVVVLQRDASASRAERHGLKKSVMLPLDFYQK